MSRYCVTIATLIGLLASSVMLFAPNASSQSVSLAEQNPFAEFFNSLATTPGVGGSRGETAYLKLAGSLETITPAEIAAGLPILDQQIGDAALPENRLAKFDAANLLVFLTFRSDIPDLLASQMTLLTTMLNDPAHFLSGQAATALQHIGSRQPKVVVPILVAALKNPDVNNRTGVGPGIAVILLRMAPHDGQVAKEIVKYMRRPDLTDNQLIDTLVGIDSSPYIPDAITSELARDLDRQNQDVKDRALAGIVNSSPAAQQAARTRVEGMKNDPTETAHFRRLAAGVLLGKFAECPPPASQ